MASVQSPPLLWPAKVVRISMWVTAHLLADAAVAAAASAATTQMHAWGGALANAFIISEA